MVLCGVVLVLYESLWCAVVYNVLGCVAARNAVLGCVGGQAVHIPCGGDTERPARLVVLIGDPPRGAPWGPAGGRVQPRPGRAGTGAHALQRLAAAFRGQDSLGLSERQQGVCSAGSDQRLPPVRCRRLLLDIACTLQEARGGCGDDEECIPDLPGLRRTFEAEGDVYIRIRHNMSIWR